MMLAVAAFVLSTLFSTVILAATLFTISSDRDNPFDVHEHIASWLRCLVLVVVAKLLLLLPVGHAPLIALVVLFGGVIFLFDCTVLEALMIVVVTAVLGVFVMYGIIRMLPIPWLAPVPLVAAAAVVIWITLKNRPPIDDGTTCPDCGYSLQGLDRRSRACPECGRRIHVQG